MLIHGKDRQFFLSVQASLEIAELCPDGDLARIREVLTGNTTKAIRFIARFVAAMNRGYENNRKYEEPGYTPDPMTVDEVLTLSYAEMTALEDEALKAFYGDVKTEIETKELKDSKSSPKKEEGTTQAD